MGLPTDSCAAISQYVIPCYYQQGYLEWDDESFVNNVSSYFCLKNETVLSRETSARPTADDAEDLAGRKRLLIYRSTQYSLNSNNTATLGVGFRWALSMKCDLSSPFAHSVFLSAACYTPTAAAPSSFADPPLLLLLAPKQKKKTPSGRDLILGPGESESIAYPSPTSGTRCPDSRALARWRGQAACARLVESCLAGVDQDCRVQSSHSYRVEPCRTMILSPRKRLSRRSSTGASSLRAGKLASSAMLALLWSTSLPRSCGACRVCVFVCVFVCFYPCVLGMA